MPFRPEHIAHFSTLASLRPPRVATAVAVLLLLGIAASGTLLVFTPWVQTAQGTGQVVALDPRERVQSVTALVPGRVDHWYVHDGEAVRQGDPIARVADNDPLLLTRLAAERAQVLAEIDAARQSAAVAQLDVGRSRELLDEGLIARRDYEGAQIKVADLRAKLAEATAKLSRVDTSLNRQSAQIVRAPRDGRIQQINAGAASTLVSPGDVLATFAPQTTVRVVELFLDGRDIALITPGRRVRLEFEGWPAVQFSGWPSLAQGLFDARVRTIDQTASPNGLFRILVEPAPGKPAWPGERFVRLGAKVRGWVMMETVPAGYELWRQLNDFPLEFPRGDDPGARKVKAPNKSKGAAKSAGDEKADDGGK